MSSNRHLGRIIALQTLYEHEFRTRSGVEGITSDSNAILQRNLEVYKDSMSDTDFVRDLVEGALKHYKDADGLVGPAAPEWPLDQIATMDLTILRLALYELMLKREVPPKVVINEAVELAKSFGGENSSKFINGVLGTIYRQSEFYDESEDHKVQRERAGSSGDQPAADDQLKSEAAPKSPQAQRSTDGEEPAVAGPADDSSHEPESDGQSASESEAGQDPAPTDGQAA